MKKKSIQLIFVVLIILDIKINFIIANSLNQIKFHRFNYIRYISVFNVLDNELAEKFCNASFDMVAVRAGEISPLPGNPGPRGRPG